MTWKCLASWMKQNHSSSILITLITLVNNIISFFSSRKKASIYLSLYVFEKTRYQVSNFAKKKKYQVRNVSVEKIKLLYSWSFSRYSAPTHWLAHGHMTSNNETVSRQMPWAGNIAKTMTSNGKQFTVTREMLTAVAGISARYSKFAFVLFCYITNHLMTGPLGKSEFCFPRLRLGKHWDSRETKFTVPLQTSH